MHELCYNTDMKEYITQDPDDVSAWVCICGNETGHAGFQPCDNAGIEIEPHLGSDWNDLYCCGQCDRIIDQNTLVVVGHNSNPATQ
jgi:hypothetical protein